MPAISSAVRRTLKETFAGRVSASTASAKPGLARCQTSGRPADVLIISMLELSLICRPDVTVAGRFHTLKCTAITPGSHQ
jgi:hypothetical protein